MSGREEQLLTSSIRDTIHLASKAETAVGELVEGFGSRVIDEHLPELGEAEDELRWYVTKLYRDIGILAERMNLPIFARQMRREFTSMKPSDLVEMDPDPTINGLYSIELGKLRGYFASISIMTSAGSVTGLHVFQTILENTAVIISKSGIDAHNESSVRNEILKVLRYAFRDAQREVSAAQIFKVYKPDIGVPSLMAAAEYKYVDSETSLKKALDDIYTDMKGYAGHYDWRNFYAVIYMTAPFSHQKDWDEQFRFGRADINWTPIIVNGGGERKAKTTGAKAPKKS
jgi:hypothetical protein